MVGTVLLVALASTSLGREPARAPPLKVEPPSQAVDAAPATEAQEPKPRPALKVEHVVLARTFVSVRGVQKPLDQLDHFAVGGTPARLPSFKALVRLASAERGSFRVKLQLRSPAGLPLATQVRTVSFESPLAQDVLFEWDGVRVSHAGLHTIVVSADGVALALVRLPVLQMTARP